MAGDSATHTRPTHSMQELRDRLAHTPVGGTLKVSPGVYRGALVIDHKVNLVGVGHATLQGDGTGTVLTIAGAGSVVRDLMIEGSGPGPVGNPAGVSVQADGVTVRNLHIRDTYTGIWVEDAMAAQVLDNVIEGRRSVAVSGATPRPDAAMAGMEMGESTHKSGSTSKSSSKSFSKSPSIGVAQGERGDGISLFNAVGPVVSGNAIVDARDGVYLEYGGGTRIECNSVTRSRYAIHSMYGRSVTVSGNHFATNQSGPVMMYGGPVTLADNVIRDQHSVATGFGVLLLDVGGVRLLRNVLVSNRVGLQLEGPLGSPQPTRVEVNTIALNQIGIGLYPTANAVLSQNSLVENTVQVLGLGPDGGGGPSKWSRDGVGNYWSNYRGYQESGSGVGRIPHVEGAAASRLLAGNPTLLALASSPAFTLLRAVEQRSAGQHPVSVDSSPLLDPRSPSLPSAAVHAKLGTGLLGGAILALCSLALVLCMRRLQLTSERTAP
ncbi:MAG: nitrous oxidase accessory protein [Actinomycetota bacterium]|nr:nitrous oxidase accessory protein [Actinomycetota bacterium]